ncbi:hypothetical protein A3A70_02530 [candidate division WWE3 bacterium RIFCSPLOWO2_01_FULL_42_11]|uniref:Lipid II flippase MurJ n=1 Tax=candidate division WWE3 bacterium RIFCSPLOWO2_01_FULL_42_11 TaxID=1802627 RepID=A0A1F4VQ90_UNCKA|nr:MAG: hypothetical protein A3A70_02530 [candidate division WWE3 bacterium RIFCSPLOWO2_01_FULL_42_11]
MSRNRLIAIDSVNATIATLLMQGAAFALTILVARSYGATSTTDAWFIALSIPGLYTAALFGALKAVFVPVFSEAVKKHPEDEKLILGSAYFLIILSSCLIAILLYFLLPFIISYAAGGLNSASRVTALDLSREVLPLVVLTSIIGLMDTIYNAHQKFLAPIFTPFIRTATVFIGVYFFRGPLGIHALSYSSVLGEALQLLILAYILKRQNMFVGIRATIHPAIKRMTHLAMPPLASSFVLEFNPLVDKIMIASTAVGSITALNIANSWNEIPLLLLGTGGFMSVILSHWSKMKAETSLETVVKSVEESLLMVSYLLIPVLAVFFAFRYPIINFFYANRQFTQEGVSNVVLLWGILIIGVLPNMLWRILVRFYHVMQDTKTPFWIGMFRSVLNILLNIIFKHFWGLPGIALSTSITAVLLFSGNFILIDRRVRSFRLIYLVKKWLVMVFIGIIMTLVCLVSYNFTQPLLQSLGRSSALISMSIGGLAGVLVYQFIAQVLGVQEARVVYSEFNKKLKFW